MPALIVDLIEFDVSDTGPGITAVERRRAFKKFTRLSPEEAFELGLELAV